MGKLAKLQINKSLISNLFEILKILNTYVLLSTIDITLQIDPPSFIFQDELIQYQSNFIQLLYADYADMISLM